MSVQIYAQSNLFPRVAVYDSSAPPSWLAKFIKLGFEVQINGVTVIKSDQQPQVSGVIQYAGAGLILLAAAWIAFRALR